MTILHDKSVDPILLLVEAPEPNDVGMGEGLQDPGLVLEPLTKLGERVSPIHLLDRPGRSIISSTSVRGQVDVSIYLNLLSPEGLLEYRNTLTPVPNPNFLRKGVAGMWTEPCPPPGPGVSPPTLETILLLTGVQGSGSAILTICLVLISQTFFVTV